MPSPTPSALPSTGRVFSITIPDSEEWTRLLIGALVALVESEYWQSGDTLTQDEMVQAWLISLWPIDHESGVPE